MRKTALREVKLLRALRHAHIVTLLDVFRQGGKLYLCFEFLEKTGGLAGWLAGCVCVCVCVCVPARARAWCVCAWNGGPGWVCVCWAEAVILLFWFGSAGSGWGPAPGPGAMRCSARQRRRLPLGRDATPCPAPARSLAAGSCRSPAHQECVPQAVPRRMRTACLTVYCLPAYCLPRARSAGGPGASPRGAA